MFQMDRKPWTAIGVVSWGNLLKSYLKIILLLICYRPIDHFCFINTIILGDGCAREGVPGVYTRVDSYHAWIQSKMAIK